MAAVYTILERFRLEHYYKGFLDIGVTDDRDFVDGVADEDLDKMGLSQVEKNRFEKYTYPKCPEPRYIRDMDPAQNTVDDLMLRICHIENVGNSKGVCLYTVDGMPLTDDPFFNTWSLKDRHIKNKDTLYAIFTPRKNLNTILIRNPKVEETSGDNTVRCHIMLKGNFEISVNLNSDTINDLRNKLANESGIPAQALHYQGDHGGCDILQDCGISEDRSSTLNFSLSTFHGDTRYNHELFSNDVEPLVPQTTKAQSVFLSSLYCVKAEQCGSDFSTVIAYIRKLTGCSPLAQSLYQLICRNMIVTKTQKIAIVEGLYMLFRELLPRPGQRAEEKPIEDTDVFEYATHCWAYLISTAKTESLEYENYATVQLTSEQGLRFCEPVSVPGTPVVFERAYVLQKIRDGEKIPNCSEVDLQESSLRRATDLEKMLLSLPPFFKKYPFWISYAGVLRENFQVNMKETFGDMTEKLSEFPFLRVMPPLLLKDAGWTGPLLIQLSEDNLGVFLHKVKDCPNLVRVEDFINDTVKCMDIDELAARTGNRSDDHTFITCRTPKEAILVLMDTSSSMEEECYGELKMKKINAVKELFDSFATRTMAYDFHHVIGLVRFSSQVKVIHTFTETLEKFKEHLRELQPSGSTVLYDALQCGVKELETVKRRFPECRLRIICLTDGNDFGSTVRTETVTINLIKSNIIVDSILLGDIDNHTLHGISNATGGCCFKPETSTDGLKLFEIETVLSLEMRKTKEKLDPSAITSESVLRSFFAQRGYDDLPETSLPSKFNDKVTVTENALKKKIQESKRRPLMEKDKRILEELRSLHCDPHPYFTIFPTESDFTFWKILMQGPPDTPYEKGVFELYCQFSEDYPVYHCNINNSGRICHNIFDRSYNAHVTMKEILDSIYGLLIAPEAEDPLDSILAEEFLSSKEKYQQEAKEQTAKTAAKSFNDKERELVGRSHDPKNTPRHLTCPLSRRIFVEPVKTKYGTVYERKAIEDHLKTKPFDPQMGKRHRLLTNEIQQDRDMKKMVREHKLRQLQPPVP
ncbi:putative bifunctional E2/E3 enzyme R795 [Merluccius polli]|uniref:Bifunctional E2/E3 enzyme R795 n=1 Tax=Merluccius polli TaxID=89951 RepID=A0AA47N7D8_MERPO|nr:putative bifunctional E2/E3 enzyme R795 [Merluccius polli]